MKYSYEPCKCCLLDMLKKFTGTSICKPKLVTLNKSYSEDVLSFNAVISANFNQRNRLNFMHIQGVQRSVWRFPPFERSPPLNFCIPRLWKIPAEKSPSTKNPCLWFPALWRGTMRIPRRFKNIWGDSRSLTRRGFSYFLISFSHNFWDFFVFLKIFLDLFIFFWIFSYLFVFSHIFGIFS